MYVYVIYIYIYALYLTLLSSVSSWLKASGEKYDPNGTGT